MPDAAFCVRCGNDLNDERAMRSGYSAAPNERANSLRLVSTLFPQLPQAEMRAFRIAFGVGAAVIALLAVAKLFPLAVAAAALLVPLMVVLYVWDVDVYEDEPLHVLAFTIAWGAVTGAIAGLVARSLFPIRIDVLGGGEPGDLLLRSTVLPLADLALMLIGPLLLLRYRKFNDVLDGATFGAASAAAFVGAQLLSTSKDLFGGGMRPGGAVLPWLIRLTQLGIFYPLMVAGAVGATAGAFWLRYRSPVRDRDALGAVGRPAVATLGAAVLAVIATLAQAYLADVVALVVLALLTAVALLWLRRTLHLGLMQEAAEVDIGPSIVCANCSQATARHTFCENCGIALAALPKVRRVKGGPASTVEAP